MDLMNNKIKKLFFTSLFLGFVSPVNSEEFQSKFVQKINIPEDSKQIYLPKAFLGVHETWSPTERLKTVSIGDTISGSDYGKKKNRSFVVGVIQCDYPKEDYFDRFGSQYSWAGKWGCIAARSENDIKEFYNFRKDRSVDVFTTNPINSEDIVDFYVSNNQKAEKEDLIDNMDQAVILQSAFNRCMLDEKVWTKEQVLTINRAGAAVTPNLFNPAIKILEKGATKSQIKQQDFAINRLGGCKNYIRTFISMTMKEDSEEMMKILDKIGFNDDLLGRPKSYFDKDQGVVFCKEPIPEFTLNYDSNPTDKEVATLCSCIWNKFPEGRWERDEMRRIFKGGQPNLKTRGFFPRFDKAMKVCGGYEL